MSGKKSTINEFDENLVQASLSIKFRKTIYLLNNNGKSDTFIIAAGLFVHNTSINSAFTKPWILDSGTTNQIASDSQFFTHISSSFIPNVNLSKGSIAPISSTGTIKFNDNITLKDVICVPYFNLNLMSFSKITSSLNCCVVFTPHGCVLQDLATGG